MATTISLDLGEVQKLPATPHVSSDRIPLVARTDETVGTGNELLVVTPGKDGIRILPYGSIFHDYAPQTNIPIFELPDGETTTWHEEDTTQEAPEPPAGDPALPDGGEKGDV